MKKSDAPCSNCGRARSEFPTIFKGGAWCSDDCRKAIQGEVTVARATVHAPDPTVRINAKEVR